MRNYFNSFFNFFEFDGRPSTDFGVMVFSHGQYSDPEPNETETRIPGMNGVLHFWDGSFKDTTVTYSIIAKGEDAIEVREKIERMRAWLLSKRKYCRLEDTFHPEYYRMGIYKGKTQVKYSENEHMGGCEIEFQCKPQMYLRTGEIPITVTQNIDTYNQTNYTAYPMLRLYGTAGQSGNFSIIGSRRLEIIVSIPSNGYIDIDTESGEAYVGNTSYNSNVTFHSTNTWLEFPQIEPGNNHVEMSNLSQAIVTPRWWTL